LSCATGIGKLATCQEAGRFARKRCQVGFGKTPRCALLLKRLNDDVCRCATGQHVGDQPAERGCGCIRRHRGAEWLEADAAGIDAVVDAEVAAGIAICFDEADFQLNLLAGTYRHRVGDAVAGKVLGNLHGAGNRGCAAHFTLQQKPAIDTFDADPLMSAVPSAGLP
jgi:hypothetical protein